MLTAWRSRLTACGTAPSGYTTVDTPTIPDPGAMGVAEAAGAAAAAAGVVEEEVEGALIAAGEAADTTAAESDEASAACVLARITAAEMGDEGD